MRLVGVRCCPAPDGGIRKTGVSKMAYMSLLSLGGSRQTFMKKTEIVTESPVCTDRKSVV